MKRGILWFAVGFAAAVVLVAGVLPWGLRRITERELMRYFRDVPLSLPFHAFTELSIQSFLSYSAPDLAKYITDETVRRVAGTIEEKYAVHLKTARRGIGSVDEMAACLGEMGLLAEMRLDADTVRQALAAIDPAARFVQPRSDHAIYHPASPPSGPVRLPAEWEPIGAVLVSWPIYFPANWKTITGFVREIVTDADALVLAPNEFWQRAVELYLGRAGLDLARVRFIRVPIDDVWVRDFGPITVVSPATGAPAFVANPYVIAGQPYYKHDAEAAAEIGRSFGLPIHYLPVIVEGGNILSDGQGTLMLADSVLLHNPDTPPDKLERIFAQYYGCRRLLLFPRLEGEVTGHIDVVVKILDEDTVMVTGSPKDHKWHHTIEDIAARLAATPSAKGSPYKVIRIPLPRTDTDFQEWTYINSLTLNRKVIVPIYGVPEDEEALRIYREAMPGHQIVGVNYRQYPVGAVHCQSKEVPQAAMDRLMGGTIPAAGKGGE